jgi:Domain of unknown function (DUF4373)
MRWFKHMTAANADDKLIIVRAKYGMWGIGVYWTILEMVARQMKKDSPEPEAALLISDLCSFFGCKRNKLVSFLKCLRNQSGIKLTLDGNIAIINIPKLLEIKDNYQKDLEGSTK